MGQSVSTLLRYSAAALDLGVAVRRGIPYAQPGGRSLKLDLYLPPERATPGPARPCVLFIHGGAWRYGSRRTNSYMCRYLAARGLLCASIDYRLSHAARWPAQFEDCRAALDWLRRHAGEFGGAGGRIGVMGTSAGAHLAALLALQTNQDGPVVADGNSPRIGAVCDWYGPSDLSAEHPVSPVAERAVIRLLGGHPLGRPELAQAASPVRQVSAAAPPFLIIHGTADPVVPFEQSRLLHEALRSAGAEATLLPVPGGAHGRFLATTPGVGELLEASASFLLEKLRQAASAEQPAARRVS